MIIIIFNLVILRASLFSVIPSHFVKDLLVSMGRVFLLFSMSIVFKILYVHGNFQ